MLRQAGGYELFLNDCKALAQKAAEDSVKVTFTVYPSMPNDFVRNLTELQDSIDSYAEIRDLINLQLER